MKLNKYQLITIGLVSLTICSGLVLTSTKSYAENDSATDDVNITVPVACTMTGTIATGQEHTATLQPGTYSGASGSAYENGIGKTTLTTFCNDYNGFSIYAIGFTDDTEGNNTLRGTSASGTATIPTKVYESTDTTSNWSMKVSKVDNPQQGDPITWSPNNMTIKNDFNAWHAVPSDYVQVAEYKSTTEPATTDTTLGAKVETTYATYISTTQPADTYQGKVKYILLHPASAEPPHPITTQSGKICYYPNGNDVEGTMGCQEVGAYPGSSTSALLLASNFSREGYGFAGWSTTYNYSDSTGFYGPQEHITFDDGAYTGSNDGLSLYAHWVKSSGSLQDWSCPNDTIMPIGSVVALTDQRDNDTYAVAKLVDGNCWMIENLRLDDSATLSVLDTNNPLNDGENVTLKHNYTDVNTFTNLSPTSNVAYNVTEAPDGWCSEESIACDNQSRIRTDNTTNRSTNSPNTDSGPMYSYGNYYNWYSATAGNGTYSTPRGKIVDGDICPIGWRLPQGGDRGQYETESYNEIWDLVVTLNDNTPPSNGSFYNGVPETNPVMVKLKEYPNNFMYSGSVSGASIGGLDTMHGHGRYWTSTGTGSNDAHYLYLNMGYVTPGTGGSRKWQGNTVRCLADS